MKRTFVLSLFSLVSLCTNAALATTCRTADGQITMSNANGSVVWLYNNAKADVQVVATNNLRNSVNNGFVSTNAVLRLQLKDGASIISTYAICESVLGEQQ